MGSGTADLDIDETGQLVLITDINKLAQEIDVCLLLEKTDDPLDTNSGSMITKLLSTKNNTTQLLSVVEVYIIQALQNLRNMQISHGLSPRETLGEIKQGSYYLEIYKYNGDVRRYMIKLQVTNKMNEGIINTTYTSPSS
jgi:hypothetical protein